MARCLFLDWCRVDNVVDGIPGWPRGITVRLLAERENGLVNEEPLPIPCYVCGKIPKLMSLNDNRKLHP